MIYRLVILSDERDIFFREIKINSNATFLELQNTILDSVNFTKDQITSFFICENNWEKKQEITLIDMGSNSDEDSFLMENTLLSDLNLDEGDRLILTYDMLSDRSFFIEVKETKSGYIDTPVCTLSKGDAPQQLISENDFLNSNPENTTIDNLDDFYGDSEFDLDEIDSDSFRDMSIDEMSEFY